MHDACLNETEILLSLDGSRDNKCSVGTHVDSEPDLSLSPRIIFLNKAIKTEENLICELTQMKDESVA